MSTGTKEPAAGSSCLFCRIASGDIPTTYEHEDDQCVAFRDLHPQAPLHLLILPRKHLAGLEAAAGEDQALLGHLLQVAAELARRQGVQRDGYRVVINTGPNGGQTVDHLHVHLLAGRRLTWPPG